jgi:hypothetical protein
MQEYMKDNGQKKKDVIKNFAKNLELPKSFANQNLGDLIFDEEGNLDFAQVISQSCIKLQNEQFKCAVEEIKVAIKNLFPTEQSALNCESLETNKTDNLNIIKQYGHYIEYSNAVQTETEGGENKMFIAKGDMPDWSIPELSGGRWIEEYKIAVDRVNEIKSIQWNSYEDFESFVNSVYDVVSVVCTIENPTQPVDVVINTEGGEDAKFENLMSLVQNMWENGTDEIKADLRNCENFDPCKDGSGDFLDFLLNMNVGGKLKAGKFTTEESDQSYLWMKEKISEHCNKYCTEGGINESYRQIDSQMDRIKQLMNIIK